MAVSGRNRSGGFTYLAALILIIIMGIMLGAVGQTCTMIMKREREEELLFRGKQIVDAIARWNKPKGSGHPPTPLRDLKDLLKDPRSLANVRYLRKMYTDPITGKEWKVILDTQGTKGVIGVASTSDDEPLRQSKIGDKFVIRQDEAYLTNMFATFEGKTKYSEWQFVYTVAGQSGSVRQTVQTPGSPFLPDRK